MSHSGKHILLLAPVHRFGDFLDECILDDGRFFPMSQAHQNWVDALEDLGCHLDVFRYTDIPILGPLRTYRINNFFSKYLGIFYKLWKYVFYHFPQLNIRNIDRNITLLCMCREKQYDYIFFSGGTTNIFPSTLRKIQKLGTKVIFFYGMSPLIYMNTFEKTYAADFDAIVTSDPIHAKEWYILGQDNAFSLPVSSIAQYHYDTYVPFADRIYDITFIGRLAPAKVYNKRVVTLRALHKQFGERLHIRTDDVATVTSHGLEGCYRGRAHGQDMFDILKQSKIVINDHGNTMPGGGNMRTFEICGAGALQMVDFVDPQWFSPGEELVTFDNVEQLIDRIQYYLVNTDSMEDIARAGHTRVFQDHTYAQHFSQLIQYLCP